MSYSLQIKPCNLMTEAVILLSVALREPSAQIEETKLVKVPPAGFV